jgi:hypothetical protein
MRWVDWERGGKLGGAYMQKKGEMREERARARVEK